MKLAFELVCCAFLVAITSASKNVDWSTVRPLHIEPKGFTPPQKGEIHGRITNGQIASLKQFPYQAGLLLYTSRGNGWCGGSLISNRWVLTAAHCTDDLTTGVDVYLGAWNRLDKTEKGQQIIFVQKRNVIIHETWNAQEITDDISLIKLPVTIQFNDYIQPVQLPKKSSNPSSYAGENAIASGWGRISDEATGATDKLRWIEVPIMTNTGCNTWWFGLVTSNNICIKTTGGLSTCNGDSGGPLVVANTKVQIGLTSFGISFGCEVGWPGVFTRITSYLDWIEKHTGIAYY